MGEYIFDSPYLENISNHVSRHFGPIASVIHELRPRAPHIDILVVEPQPNRNFYLFVTCGMSTYEMTVNGNQEDQQKFGRFEILFSADVNIGKEFESHFTHDKLRSFARMPYETGKYLGPWHTVANGSPPLPYTEDVLYNGFLFYPPFGLADSNGWHFMAADGNRINFMEAFAILPDELEFALRSSGNELVKRLAKSNLLVPYSNSRRSASLQ